MKLKALCSLLLLGLLISPASANIMVSFVPQDTQVALDDGPFLVDIVANIPQADAVVGWGLDLTVLDPLVAAPTGVFTIGPAWIAADTMDGDGLAGLAFPDAVWGNGIVLASIEFMPLDLGVTDVTLSDDSPTDLTEGFAKFSSGFASVDYVGGTIEVIPEPATLLLLTLGGLVLRRRWSVP